MDESEENISSEDINNVESPMSVKIKQKKRSLVERELETNLTARVTSPATGEGSSTSRYGRARRLKTATESDTEKIMKPLKIDVSKQPLAYKMHASNSPISKDSPKRTISVGSSIEDQIENIYNENISLSRFGSEEKVKTQSPSKKLSKVYIRKDLIQKPDTDTVVLIKNMFSPNKSSSHLSNVLERSSEKYSLNGHGKAFNGFPDSLSVVKTLDFDGKKKNKQAAVQSSKKEKLVTPVLPSKKEVKEKGISKNELFELEAACEYQVGDLAWARVGTYPFWPCIVTREPYSDMFVKKKLFGRVERSVIHVTFFGDNGRRGWIVDNMLRKYHGRAEFEACRDKFTPESKKKDPRLYAAHFVSEKKLSLWNVSVEEAETLMKEPKRFRIDALYDMLEKARAAKTTPSKREKSSGGKITRTDSDVSLSESLYDTLFSEEDGKSDDIRSKRPRNKSLDVSEVVTACLDNMAAKSGIIQIQKQSHMDRWLQKAKSKTPEKIQPKLHVKVEREKRKDKAKKKKEAKLQKMRKNESLGSDTNLLPYQNEHDYSSVNYENHNINESSNKNTDSASGLDSTMDSSTTLSDIGVTIKIENISSSMEDCNQEDIITTVVNDDILMTDSENNSKDNDHSKNEMSHEDYTNNEQDNITENIEVNKYDKKKSGEIKEQHSIDTSDLTNTTQPRRSKRKRQTFEGLSNSITENKAKEPKLDLKTLKYSIATTSNNEIPVDNKNQENQSGTEVSENFVADSNLPIITNTEKEISEKNDLETLMPLKSDLILVNDIQSSNSTATSTDNDTPTITMVEKDTTQNSIVESTDDMLCDSELIPKVDIEPLNLENTESNVPTVEKETAQNTKVESKDLTSFTSASTPVLGIQPLYSDISTTDRDVPTLTNLGEENFQSRKHESTEHLPFNDKSTPVVVIEPLNTVHEMVVPTVKPFDKDKSNTKVDSTALTLFNSKCKPVVVIEPLNYENSATEISTQSVTILEKESYQNTKHDSIEVVTFHKSSKPVVVIEPLDMNGLETQFIIKASKQLVLNKPLHSVNTNNNNEDKLEAPGLLSDVAQNNASSILKDVNNISEASITIEDHPEKVKIKPETSTNISSQLTDLGSKEAQDNISKKDERSLADSERMEIDDSASSIAEEEQANLIPHSENTVTKSDITVSRVTKDYDDPDQSMAEKNDKKIEKSTSTNVVIGEETYVFDRTLSQDYDEIDGDYYGEYSHLPPIIINKETENAILVHKDPSNLELSTTHDSCKTSNLQITENMATCDVNGSMIVDNDLKLIPDDGNLENNSSPLVINKISTVTGDVSSIVNEENNPNQVSQDNNDKCVFLDQSLEIADAPLADSIEKKRKSPRLSLNRTRNRPLKLKNINDLIETRKIITEKVNIDPVKRRLKTTYVNSHNDKVSISRNAAHLKERRDSRKSKNNPEFLKYMEIHQDALLDEQPDLTQDEIFTYLYQNWLYEESKNLEIGKIDDIEQSKLIKDFEEPNQTKKKQKKPKIEKATMKSVDIRDMLHKGKPKLSLNKSSPERTEEQAAQQQNDLQTVESLKKINLEPEETIKATDSINLNNKDISTTRRSRRSREKHSIKNLKEKIVPINSNVKENTRRSQSSKHNEDIKHAIDTENSVKEIGSVCENGTETSLTNHIHCKGTLDTTKAMNNPKFITYLNMHQDALLDEQPDLTKDEIVTYLYKNWLYDESNNSEMKKIDDNQQSNLLNDQETAPDLKHNLYTLENNATKAIADAIGSNDMKMSNPQDNGSRKQEEVSTEEKLQPIQSTIRECVLEMRSLNDSEMSSTKRTNKKQDTKQTTKPEEKVVDIMSLNNSINTETVDTKRTGRVKDVKETKLVKNEPEFIKYLEMHQDALLDEQPDLTQDEIVTYLYQNWLYEEGNKSEMKKIDDNEQSNLVKGFNPVSAPQKKLKKKSKVPLSKNVNIRNLLQSSKPIRSESVIFDEKGAKEPDENNIIQQDKTPSEGIDIPTHESIIPRGFGKKDNIVSSESLESNSIKEHTSSEIKHPSGYVETLKETTEKIVPINETLSINNVDVPENSLKHLEEAENKEPKTLDECNDETNETVKKSDDIIEDVEFGVDELEVKENNEGAGQSAHLKIINGFIDFEENSSKSKMNYACDPETASTKSEDSGVSITRKGRREKDVKKSMDDPDFLKYLEARQDALIEEQPDLTQDEIVTYLYQTWFYEESTKSDLKKNDETEQSNLVKGLNQETVPQPKKIKKKPKVEKESAEKVNSIDIKDIKVEKPDKVLKNADIRDMIQKPKRKATQSKPYYNEEDSDLEEEDLETFKIFDRDEQNEDGEEIDEVELYFEQLTKPKPNVFKGYVRERVCEICYRTANLVKCKSCHGTYHIECVKKDTEATEISGPTRGRKKKRGRKPKGFDPSIETGSQSDERSQDANNSEEINISIEDETEFHIVIDEDNFETLWENKMKELQTDNQDDYVSDQEIDWQVEPGHCEIVDLKHKEKPIDYSDYKCNKCLKYETPVCFVCQSNKSPKSLIETRQKCQVAHCHRYYHLECLDHWPQTQFNSWEPSKTNKKQIDYVETLSCPRHVCHTCVSDDPRGCKTRFCGDKLARCVKCPATYHSYTKCLPAGSTILTGSQIICPRHYEHRPGKVPCHVNTGWCFICALGGTLICCEYCPTSFHAECLNIKPPEGSYMCEDCETGRLPLYGEMVWVKLGHYRWWPGIVLHPTEIPENIMAVKHSQGEFVVRFFGQYDHYWVNRGRVFPFQEGDSGRISSQKSKIDAAFTMAMEHAQRACEILKKMQPNEEEDLDIASSLLPPHYVKLKVNKPVGNVARRDVDANSLTQCDCDPNQPDPCGPYSHCLNRMLLTECGPLCRAGERCHNRAFERRRYPRLAPHRAPARGWGLRALEDIKQGQFVIEYVGELIDMEEFRRRMCRKHEIRDENFYFLTLDKERMIDAGPKGNLARFMNHCCEPNCETQKWTVLGDVRVGLFALRDIPANSEVTFNYNLECAGIEKKRCLCGAARCSGYIGAKPKQLQEDKPNKAKPTTKRTYKKRKPVEETIAKPKTPRMKIKTVKPRELTEIEKDLLIIKNATNGMSSDSEGSRLSVDDKNPKALKRKRVSFSTDEFAGKKAKLADGETEAV